MVAPLTSLRGLSAEALQVVGDKVEAGARPEAESGELGQDLFRVAALLRAEPALRRAATDVSSPAEAKAALVRGLLTGKVSDAAVEVVAEAAAQRWVATGDLADALEHLGVVATVRGADRSDAGRLSDELFTVTQLVEDNPELRIALSDPVRSTEDKARLLDGLLEGKVLPATLALVHQGLTGSFRTVHDALSAYQKVAAAVHDESVALVRTAKPLGEAEERRLAAALEAQQGHPVHLNVEVDPSLLGGMRIEIGDTVIDGTVAARLDDARRRLAG